MRTKMKLYIEETFLLLRASHLLCIPSDPTCAPTVLDAVVVVPSDLTCAPTVLDVVVVVVRMDLDVAVEVRLDLDVGVVHSVEEVEKDTCSISRIHME